MPITTNSGGVLHNLSPIYARNGGILNELSTIYARNGGVLSTIYEKNSGSGGGESGGGDSGGGDSGGGEVTPPVDPTRKETFHWGNYTGTANTTPHCIGSFTIDESMNCTYDMTTFHNMESLCPTPTESKIEHDVPNNKMILDIYYYGYNIFIRKSLTDTYNIINWEHPESECYVQYILDKSSGKFNYYKKQIVTDFYTSTAKPLEKGTYYVYFSNYIKLCTKYQANVYYTNLVKYMPWDNMSVDVTLTLEPIS